MHKNSCPYCGNNPVPHYIYWYNESLNILFTPLRQMVLYNPLSALFKRLGWGRKLALFFLFVGESLKIISRQKNEAACKVRRAQVLWEEGKRRGITMEELLVFGKPFDSYVAEKSLIVNPLSLTGNKKLKIKDQRLKIVFSGLPRPEGYSNRWLDLMDDKWLLKKKLMENNLPVPMGRSVSSFKQALQVFDAIDNSSYAKASEDLRPVIVKPRGGSRGRHTTTFVSSQSELHRAYKIAKQLCFWVMVEEQLTGPVYRATLINFELCGVLRGDPPQIIGDGQNNIAEIITQKNSAAHPGVKDIIVDDRVTLFLSRQGLSLTSIPKKDELINLSEKIGVNYGGSSSEDFEICHPDNKQLFTTAAKVLGDPIVGFDFIIPDISKSYKDQKCGFIEVNSLPFINLHHDPLLGKPRNVAAKVWEMIGW